MKFIKMVVLLLYFGVALTHAALAAQEEGYNITVPDYIDIEKNLTISNILSYSDVTKAYDAAPWGLDWGKNRAPYKWKVTMAKGDVTIGFERYETISTNPQVITFYRTVTEQRGSHPETRYREARPVQKAGIMGISAGIQATGWWNSAWQYRIDNPLPNGVRPYQLSLTLSNSAGTNTATHIFLNGHAKSDFSDIRFTLNNAIELPYWIESAATGKVWVRVPDNGTVNIYYGNPSASDLSDGKSTFEFFDDFNTLDLGANPVIVPTQSWENVGYLRWGTIAYLNGIYYIYYTNGASSTSDIGRASSTDLITWTKNANNPVILNRIGPSLLKDLDGKTPVFVDGKYWMLTMKSDGSAIELRSSPALDGNTWTLENANLIPKGGTWHTNYLYTTSFVRENGNYYIVMESGTPGVSWKIGYFKASTPKGPYIDNGVLLSPTLPWEGKGVLDPEMRKFGNTYYLFYTGNDVFPYQNSYAYNSLSLGGAYQKSSIIVTPGGQSYPAILQKDSYYYILADDQPTKYTGKSLFRRKDLNGPFGSPFEWNKGGTPTVSGSELLINANGEFLRSSSNFLYKAMKIRAKYAPTSAANSFQYFGFVPSSAANENPSEMFFSRENTTNTWIEAWSGNPANSESTPIYNQDYFGSYHNYEILWRNGEAKFIIDDALKATQTTSVADSSMPVGIYDYNTDANLDVDWVFVRNYVSPEPAWGVWSAEQASQNGGAPSITGLPQESQVGDIVGAIRTFNITANQAVNVTWYLNGTEVLNRTGVIESSYTNTSAKAGIWNINATATNDNGTVSKEWTWNVISQSPSEIKSITVSPSDISVIRRGTMQLNIPTYDGSGQAVHPDVYYNANGWRGYKYWMVMTPYPNGNDAYENPSILVSNEGISWSVPQGLQNPIDPKPASGSNSDVDIVYNETADRIEIYYVESGAGTSYLIRKTSGDGITWSAEKNTMLVPDYQVMSPAIIKNGSVYDMWYTGGASCSADTIVKFATSADGINWSSPQMVNIQSDLNIWHLDVSYIPSQNEYWMVYAAYPKGSTCGNTDLYFAKSKDKINWTNYPDIILTRGASWDSSQIYRSTFLFNDTSNTMRIWYSARGGVAWHIGYVEKQYFSAKAKDQSGQTVNVSIMWASSNVYVGTITSGGLFSALSNGMTTITASNGTVSGTAKVQVTDASLPGQPSITSYIPASPISDIGGATRTFSVTMNQGVNVTWFINSNQVQFNGSVSSASYTNTSAKAGIWNISATAANDNGSTIQTWEWYVTSLPPVPPVITDNSPLSPVEDTEGSIRTFNIKVNQTVNVSWYLNGTEVLKQTGVIESSYTNTSAKAGIWNISATASNDNGSTIQTWEWNVIKFIFNDTIKITSPSGNVTVTILKGTNASVGGEAIRLISIDSLAQLNSTFIENLSSNDRLIGENLSLGPEGATFRPDIQI